MSILAAVQPLSLKRRLLASFGDDLERRAAHFRKWNLGAATYDAAYCREIGAGYLPSLTGWVERAAKRGARLVLLPEFCLMPGVLAAPAPGQPANPRALADAVELYAWSGGQFAAWASALARRLGIYLAAALPMVEDSRIYNTGLLVDPHGNEAGRYRKTHLPPGEIDHFAPGQTYPVFATELGRVGFSICYDIQFPEAMACLAQAGAQIVLHPSAGFTLPDESPDMGLARLRVRASDHFCAIVYSCTAPEKPGEPHSSCVIAPNGDCLARVAGKRTGIAVAEVTVGGKRSWPGDGVSAPDREAVRRSLRRPTTYGGVLDA